MSAVAVTDEALSSLVEDALRRRLAAGIASAEAYGPDFVRLWQLTAETALGGKLVRPRLLLDAFDAFHEGATPKSSVAHAAVELAATVELLHYGFLLHDDVLDGDTVRRGRPNLIGALAERPSSSTIGIPERNARHWGRTGAVLMGDLLLTSSVLGFARADVPASLRGRLLDLLESVILETVVGEHTDVGFSDGVITPELPRILAMTTRKTAAYSFELPLRAAAILAEATSDGAPLSDVIAGQFAAAQSAFSGIDDSFSQQITSNNAQMLTAYESLQQLVVLTKLDMMQALNITIDYVDGDGD